MILKEKLKLIEDKLSVISTDIIDSNLTKNEELDLENIRILWSEKEMKLNSCLKIDDNIKNQFRSIGFLKDWGEANTLDFYVDSITSDELAEFLSDDNWENVTIDAVNQLSAEVLSKNKEVFSLWNQYSSDSREFVKNELICDFSLSFSQSIVDCIRWDIIHLVLYFQYRFLLNIDIIPFYEKMFLIYKNGHFPCGWVNGEYPDGNFVVV